MKPISRILALLLCLLVLAQSARSDTACGATSGVGQTSGMPSSHQMDGHPAPTPGPQHHPCGPMSGALCQMMTGCMDLGAPPVAVQVVLTHIDRTAPRTVASRIAPLRDLAPPLTPPRA